MNEQSSTLQIPTAKVLEPLLQPSRYKGIYGGRGALKSHFFSGLGVERALMQPGFRMICGREVQKTLQESAKKLIENKINEYGVMADFRVLNDRIITPGAGLIIFQGLADHTAESIKSLEDFDVAWMEESQTLSKKSLEFLRPTIRKENSELWFGWNPRNPSDPVDKFLRGLTPPKNAIIISASYKDNPWFPSVLEEERQHDYENSRDRYAHVWLGEYEPVAIGAIWDREILHAHRKHEAPEMGMIVVAVDPAISNEENSDEHGIIVAGIGSDKRGYVLADVSLKGGPIDWATRTIAAFDEYEADCIVIEINQGGDMVRHTLDSIRPGLPIKEVRATRGKHIRAEPISSLYKTGRVSHVGTFPELEDQMVKMTAGGYEGDGSPDRLDAMVWAMTKLFPALTKKPKKEDEPMIIPKKSRFGHTGRGRFN